MSRIRINPSGDTTEWAINIGTKPRIRCACVRSNSPRKSSGDTRDDQRRMTRLTGKQTDWDIAKPIRPPGMPHTTLAETYTAQPTTDAIRLEITTRPSSPAPLIALMITVLSTKEATATPASITAVPCSSDASSHCANGPEANAIATIDTTANTQARRQVVARNRLRPAQSLRNSGYSLAVAVPRPPPSMPWQMEMKFPSCATKARPDGPR